MRLRAFKNAKVFPSRGRGNLFLWTPSRLGHAGLGYVWALGASLPTCEKMIPSRGVGEWGVGVCGRYLFLEGRFNF